MGLFVAQGSLIAGVAPHRSGRFGTSAGRGLGAGSPVTSLRARAIRRRGGVASGATAVLRDGQMVTIHYVMKFADGEVGDDTFKRDAPATLPIGQGQLFAALEDGIKAMSEGETRTFEILCKDAYGPRDESKVQKLPASPDELEALKERVHPGKMVQLPNGATAICLAIEADGIVLDNNHPLADKDLTFEVTLVGVADGPELFGVPVVAFDVNKVAQK